MRLRLLVVLSVALAFAQTAKADSVFSYSLGLALQNTVTPGSTVSINAVLLNTGSLPIAFAPISPVGGPPSVQGGSLPGAGVTWDGEWSILENQFSFGDFFAQFDGVTLNPGEELPFVIGTFVAPTNQALGTSAMPRVNVQIQLTDTIDSVTCIGGVCDFNTAPHPMYTLGSASSSSDLTFFQATIIDNQIVQVPEPAFWEMFGVTLALMAGVIFSCRSQCYVKEK